MGSVFKETRARFARVLPACGQRFQAAQSESRPPLRIVGIVEPEIWQMAQQRIYGDLSLDTGELGPKAMMDAAAERERTTLPPRDIEAVGIGKGLRIAIGGAKQAKDRLALGEIHAADLDILERGAPDDLDRRIVAQEFLDRTADQRGIFPQESQLVGVSEKRQKTIADEVNGGLMPG